MNNRTLRSPQRSLAYTLLLIIIPLLNQGCLRMYLNDLEMYDQIETMKEKPVFVRLVSNDNKLAYLKRSNDIKSFVEEKARLKSLNEEIILAVGGEFNFSKVYFFLPTPCTGLEVRGLRQRPIVRPFK